MGRFAKALSESLADVQLAPRHNAGVMLARKYAALLDEWDGLEGEEEQFATLGPKYLQALKALGLTPTTRERGDKDDGGAQGNPLGKLIALRGAASRQHTA